MKVEISFAGEMYCIVDRDSQICYTAPSREAVIEKWKNNALTFTEEDLSVEDTLDGLRNILYSHVKLGELIHNVLLAKEATNGIFSFENISNRQLLALMREYSARFDVDDARKALMLLSCNVSLILPFKYDILAYVRCDNTYWILKADDFHWLIQASLGDAEKWQIDIQKLFSLSALYSYVPVEDIDGNKIRFILQQQCEKHSTVIEHE